MSVNVVCANTYFGCDLQHLLLFLR